MNENETELASVVEFSDSERQRCEVWTRVMGYHRPVASFNLGKKSEHYERLHFSQSRCESQICAGAAQSP